MTFHFEGPKTINLSVKFVYLSTMDTYIFN